MNAGVGQTTKVVDVQHRAMHHKGAISDPDAAGTRVQVGSLVKINIPSQVDMIGKAQSDTVFDRSHPIHAQDQAIQHRAEGNAKH